MAAYISKRLFHSLFVLVGVVVIVFAVTHMVGDPARLTLPPNAQQELYQDRREALGLDDPFLTQFLRFAGNVIHGDFGISIWQQVPALPLVLDRLPKTLYLGAVTMLIAVPLAVSLGFISAVRPQSFSDRLVSILSYGSVSIPEFWIGLMLILLVAVKLDLLPTSGYGGLQYVALPAISLSLRPLGRITQITRNAVLEEMAKPYVNVARAKGLTDATVMWRHILKNAAIPVITICGDEMAALLNGAVVIETIFGWPGLGQLMIQAIGQRDLPLIEATVFVVIVMVIVTNLVVDLVYSWLQPRLRYR